MILTGLTITGGMFIKNELTPTIEYLVVAGGGGGGGRGVQVGGGGGGAGGGWRGSGGGGRDYVDVCILYTRSVSREM